MSCNVAQAVQRQTLRLTKQPLNVIHDHTTELGFVRIIKDLEESKTICYLTALHNNNFQEDKI